MGNTPTSSGLGVEGINSLVFACDDDGTSAEVLGGAELKEVA
jgi:hypothetical protein